MPPVSQVEFERCAITAELLSEEQLDEARTALAGIPADTGQTDAKRLADQLVRSGQLNAWQANQLLEGRTRFSLGKYRMIDSLGRGGMGQVFLAYAGNSTRQVAVKVLPKDRATPLAVEAFRREMGAQAGLNHPNLVQAIDAGFDGNVYYLVSEYVPGQNLRQLVRKAGPLRMDLAAWIIAQAAAGLEHAHQNGWIHRDVKPGNILVMPDGHAKLSDLGLAGPLTVNGNGDVDDCFNRIAGTVDYLCPDQIRNPREPTPAWDIYSLGCTLYYAVTGKVLFPGGTPAEKARAHCDQMPIDPRRFVEGLSDEFVDVLVAMLAKDPQYRLASARAVIERLRPFYDPESVTAEASAAKTLTSVKASQDSKPTFRLDLPESLSEKPASADASKMSPLIPLLFLVVPAVVVSLVTGVVAFLLK